MGADLIWAGGIAAALLAIGQLLRVTVRRLISTVAWGTAAVRLPEVVDGLALAVEDLATSVADLSRALEALQHHQPAPALHLESA